MATQKRTTTTAGRFYHIEDRDLPSVTTILGAIAKPALVKWAENTAKAATMDAAADLYYDLSKIQGAVTMPRHTYLRTLDRRIGQIKQTERETQKALEIGSQTHALIEWSLKRALGRVATRPATTPPAEWAFMAYEDWAKSVDLQPIFVEQTVWSLEHGYAGTLDLLARVNGEVTLIDFKTSKAIYAEYDLQSAAYQHALEEMGHSLPPGGGLIVRLPKVESDPQFEVKACRPVTELLPVFLSVLQVWQWWYAAEQASKAAWKAKKDAATAAVA